ncbi:unnamed protein product [Polarella glacialis]|uniref:Spondin-like TSP1 domain-containing protein n=1 Tax=Polarella glacialis TaxID=89957 RepID=A0A813DUD0_POLGL|nr:unnamed protein product [Polarella glacialis]
MRAAFRPPQKVDVAAAGVVVAAAAAIAMTGLNGGDVKGALGASEGLGAPRFGAGEDDVLSKARLAAQEHLQALRQHMDQGAQALLRLESVVFTAAEQVRTERRALVDEKRVIAAERQRAEAELASHREELRRNSEELRTAREQLENERRQLQQLQVSTQVNTASSGHGFSAPTTKITQVPLVSPSRTPPQALAVAATPKAEPPTRVLVFGGFDGTADHRSTEVLDLKGMIFSVGPTMGVGRSGCAVAALDERRVLVAGGFDGSRSLDSTEVVDPVTLMVSPGPSMATRRNACAAVRLDIRRLLVIGGSDDASELDTTEVLDLETMSFSAGPRMGTRRNACAASLLDRGRLIVIGGSDGCSDLDTTEVLDLASMTFSAGPRMGTRRNFCATATLPVPGSANGAAGGNLLLVLGGSDGSSSLDSTEVLDVSQMAFRPGPSMGTWRSGCAAPALSDSLLGLASARGAAAALRPEWLRFDGRGGLPPRRPGLPLQLLSFPLHLGSVEGGVEEARMAQARLLHALVALLAPAASGGVQVQDCHGEQTEWGSCLNPAACNQCTPVNCEFGEWGQWHAETCNGLRFRERVIRTKNNECGRPCEGEKVQSEAWFPESCKSAKHDDCKFSEWTQWSHCISKHPDEVPQENFAIVHIGRSSSSVKCVQTTVPMICDVDAGNVGRLDSHPDKFEVSRMGGRICAKRIDVDSYWSLDLVLRCKEIGDEMETVYIGSNAESSKRCVIPSAPVKCGNKAAQRGRTDHHPDTFSIYHEGGKICAARSDADAPWPDVDLVLYCEKDFTDAGAWLDLFGVRREGPISPSGGKTFSEDQQEQLGVDAYGKATDFAKFEVEVAALKATSRRNAHLDFAREDVQKIHIGTSEKHIKCVQTEVPVHCGADSGNAGRTDNYADVFEVYREGGKICVERIDTDSSWGIDLVLTCDKLDHLGKVDIGSSLHADTKCVKPTVPVKCDNFAAQRGRTDHHPDTFQIYHEGDLVCAKRTDYPNPWSLNLVLHCDQVLLPDWQMQVMATQSTRHREVLWDAGNQFGTQCTGATNETRACTNGAAVDCALADWHDWTSCSTTCGRGRHTRMRDVSQEARFGGLPCPQGSLLQTKTCSLQPCGHRDCALTAWTEWSKCTGEGVEQRFRRRDIRETPWGGGASCPPGLLETGPCPPPTTGLLQELLSGWSSWSRCDKSCGGGQTKRIRHLLPDTAAKDDAHLAAFALEEEAACNTQFCPHVSSPNDCSFTDWSSWSGCSADCGVGARTRDRRVSNLAGPGGRGCEDSLMETAQCSLDQCYKADCSWGQWSGWSGCPVTCGGGMARRHRSVAIAPKNGGKICEPLAMAEAAPCNSQSCSPPCQDGLWGTWQEWTQCSATCSASFKSRRRDMEVPPNHCGTPASGLQEQFVACPDLPPCHETQADDCQVSSWSAWSACSCSCFGIRERNRGIKVFATEGGQACDQSLRVIEACNPMVSESAAPGGCERLPATPKPVDCVLSDWIAWSACTVSCGGGQRGRHRKVTENPSKGGKPCEDVLAVTEPCGHAECPHAACQDCVIGPWQDWSGCTGCDGQKRRHRNIERLPDKCGKTCNTLVVKETTGCADQSQCDEGSGYCVWSPWSGSTGCFGYGAVTTMRSRSLHFTSYNPRSGYLFQGDDAMTKCAGAQVNVSSCPKQNRPEFLEPKCIPVDCEFSEWNDWSESFTVDLCQRARAVVRTNNECGKPCSGPLETTKVCEHDRVPKDCVIAAWSEWSYCTGSSENAQKYRDRQVLQEPGFGGTPCEGSLHDTLPCNGHPQVNCQVGAWNGWGACSQSCGAGWQARERRVLLVASEGADRCTQELSQLQPCSGQSCDQTSEIVADCQLGEWESWGHCQEDGQRYRSRGIAIPAMGGGKACEDVLMQAQACNAGILDCQVSAWSEWGNCDRTCANGQAKRQRQIQRFPQNGGKPCPGDLMETIGCGVPCNHGHELDCVENSWSEWSTCSGSCGMGVETRTREVKSLRTNGGMGCQGPLGQTRQCHNTFPCTRKEDCEWNAWNGWGQCSVSCGGGMQNRERRVLRIPEHGGALCEGGATVEVQACGTQACHKEVCHDSLWANWQEWSPCSASCSGGTTFRIRAIALMGNSCGKQALGEDRETAFCNIQRCHGSVDCRFSSWEAWSSCSSTCDGTKSRARTVEEHGLLHGAFCLGPIVEVSPCQPGVGESQPTGCGLAKPQDCELSDWVSWGTCSATCGGGEHERSRFIVAHAADRVARFIGIMSCTGALSEVRGCARQPCESSQPVSCKLGEWQEWQVCDRCDGERKRYRHILSYAAHGGSHCKAFDGEELGSCPRSCNEQFCGWASWESWSACIGCGTGSTRFRRRMLNLTDNSEDAPPETTLLPLPGELLAKYALLPGEVKDLETHRQYELVLAFASGIVSVVLGLGVLRARGSAQRRSETEGAGYQHLHLYRANDMELAGMDSTRMTL